MMVVVGLTCKELGWWIVCDFMALVCCANAWGFVCVLVLGV